MKTTTYSWRVTVERRAQLEAIAKKTRRPVAQLLDEAVVRLIDEQSNADDAAEAQLRKAAMLAIGRIAGGDPERASQSQARVRELLLRRRASTR